MQRLTAHDFAPEVLKLFDQYVRGQISRRGCLDGAAYKAARPGWPGRARWRSPGAR